MPIAQARRPGPFAPLESASRSVLMGGGPWTLETRTKYALTMSDTRPSDRIAKLRSPAMRPTNESTRNKMANEYRPHFFWGAVLDMISNAPKMCADYMPD